MLARVATACVEREPRRNPDYVVIGAGSAGGVVAARLSEDPSVEVMLIEAGKTPKLLEERIPAAASKLQDTPMNWRYITEEQKQSCQGSNDKRAHCPAGKCLGGSSQINYLAYVRGHKADFDSWVAKGAKGWSWEEMLSYHKKIENCELPTDNEHLKVDPSVHGTGGPLNVSTKMPMQPIAQTIVDTAKALNHPLVDYNDGTSIGVSMHQMNTKNGARAGVYESYLKPIIGRRPNLTVVTEALVERIVFEGKRAVGVKYQHQGQSITQKVVGEVIVSAGAIASPKILMLSGVGDKRALAKHGIESVHDNWHVGQHLQDHVIAPLLYLLKPGSGSINGEAESLANLANWGIRGKGPLASTVYDASIFSRTGLTRDHAGPDVQIGIFSSHGNEDLYKNIMFNAEDFFDVSTLKDKKQEGCCLLPAILRPRSEGSIALKDADPSSYPLIDPNYFYYGRDAQVLAKAVEIALDLGKTSPFSEKIDRLAIPERFRKSGRDGDIDWDAYIRAHAIPHYDYASTCRIGDVVDSQLKVIGLENVRVADASVAPHLVSGNTNATCIVIGEKAADLIKQDQQRVLGR